MGVINSTLSALALFIEPWLSGNPFYRSQWFIPKLFGGRPDNTRLLTMMNGGFARTEPLASHLQLRTHTCSPPLHRKPPCVCLTAFKSKAIGSRRTSGDDEVERAGTMMCAGVQVTFSASLKLRPYMCLHVSCVSHLVLCRALSLVSCADMWFMCSSVFMYKCSMCLDLCLNSQLLKVPHSVTCSFSTHGAACFTH